MTCPNCGAENAEGVRFCGSCGHDLATPAPVAPGATPGSPRPQAPSITLAGPSLLAAAGIAVVVLGFLVWAVFFKGGGGSGVQAVGAAGTQAPPPRAAPTVAAPAATSSASAEPVVSPTGSPSAVAPTTPSESEAPSAEPSSNEPSPSPAGAATFTIYLCRDVVDAGCQDTIIFDNGWVVPADTPTFFVYVSAVGLQPGDRIGWTYRNASAGESLDRPAAVFDPAPPEVGDFGSWAYWDEWALPEGRVWLGGLGVEIVLTHNDQVVGFPVPSVFTFQ